MILTRYLYNKPLVLLSMESAILKKNYNESLFWAYELYFSGFQEEVLYCLEEIFIRCFKENHPKLGLYIDKKKTELEGKPELIATIIKNLTMKNAEVVESPRVKFVNVKEHHIVGFYTKESNNIPNWKFLREVCLYGVLVSENKTEKNNWCCNWLLYCLHTPIWSERISEYGLIQDNQIFFKDGDSEEEFHNLYDYEPDEQPTEIRIKCIGY